MHRDKKTGLALAVLLCGIVGALFFRNERHPGDNLPALENPEAIDSEIAHRQVVPYLQQTESPENARATQERPAGGHSEPAAWKAPDWLPGRKPESRDEPVSLAPGPPNPIPVADRAATEREAAPPSSRNTNWTPTVPQQSPANPEGTAYLVQQGDTLSGIAARFLGSGALYMEIYAANRDLLKTPNDLRAGMTIRIPQRDKLPPPVEFPEPPPRPTGDAGARRVNRLDGVELHPVSAKSLPVLPPVPSPAVELRPPAKDEAPRAELPSSGTPAPQALRTPEADTGAQRPVLERPAPVKIETSGSEKPAMKPPVETAPQESAPGSTSRKFVPVPRNPLAPRSQGLTPEAARAPAPGKTLSQLPPTDVPPLDTSEPGTLTPFTEDSSNAPRSK